MAVLRPASLSLCKNMAVNVSRRNLLRGRFQSRNTSVFLPWLKSSKTFYSDCTKCNNCISACPEDIIVASDDDYPNIEFRLGECTFCGACSQSCPENLFSLESTDTPWHYKANIDRRCLALAGVECRSCQDACPEFAIGFRLKLGEVPTPELDIERCSGCGACVGPCPAEAISIGHLESMPNSRSKQESKLISRFSDTYTESIE